MKRREPRLLGAIIENMIDATGLRPQYQRHSIEAVWPQVVGKVEVLAVGVGDENLAEGTGTAHKGHYAPHASCVEFVENVVEQHYQAIADCPEDACLRYTGNDYSDEGGLAEHLRAMRQRDRLLRFTASGPAGSPPTRLMSAGESSTSGKAPMCSASRL